MEENKSENILKKVLTGVVLVLVIGSLVYILNTNEDTDQTSKKEIKKQLARIEEVLNKMDEEYIEKIDYEKAGDEALNAILQSTGDPYTRHVSKEEYNEMINSGFEKYAGIGVHLVFDVEKKCASVVSVMPDTPAYNSDIQIGDEIIKVEDVTITDIDTYTKSAEKLRGKEDTNVKLDIRRKGEIINKEITRKLIKVNNITSSMLENNIGYIKILEFDNNADIEFKNEYKKLAKQNMKGLVLDLRNNPGGMVPPTVKIADMLLPDGDVILKTKYKNGNEKIEKGKDGQKIDIPLVVLVNGQSASASEILTSCIKDYGVGTVIGEKTFGKGIVQGVMELQNKDAASITIAKYYTKNGAEIHKKGIEPDIKVEVKEEESKRIVIPKENDTVLKKAIEEISKKMK